jgi:outer membrane receptor protein involved in Fe transport
VIHVVVIHIKEERGFMRKVFEILGAILLLAVPVFAADQPDAQQKTARELGEGLIYSVDRVPERPFDTSRAVEVITAADIKRKNALSLSDILTDEGGFIKYRTTQASVSPVIRGLLGRQILILIDGVKVNNALFGDTPNMDLIDVSMIERIEIVRGVVSVLGTESLGGVVNIITRKAEGKEKIGGTVGLRYSTNGGSWATPLSVHGTTDKLRWIASIANETFGEAEGGKGVGVQRFTDYSQRSANLGADYFISPEKTLSVAYHGGDQVDVKSPGNMISGVSLLTEVTPSRLQIGSLSYQDLTDRKLFQSLRVTSYLNVQDTGTSDVRAKTPTLQSVNKETDRMAGLNLELGSFVGAHHLVWGLDFSRDTITSFARDTDSAAHTTVFKRGRYTDGARYETAGVYLQDQFDVTKWVTVTGGLRYGNFKTEGVDNLPVVGAIDLGSKKSDLTSAVGVVVHAAPNINVIGNFIRGFRAPNLRDISSFALTTTTLTIPALDAEAERMISYEGGVKYDSPRFSGSAFYFRNRLSNLLVSAVGTYKGLNFYDANGNGKRDTGELGIRENQNIGTASLRGYELDLSVHPTAAFTVYGTYTNSTATTKDTLQATLVQRVPPPWGSAGMRYALPLTHAPWAELVYTFTKSFRSNGVLLSPIFREYKVRTGMAINERWQLTVSGENLNDQKYNARFAAFAYPGRRLIVGTEYSF